MEYVVLWMIMLYKKKIRFQIHETLDNQSCYF